MGTTDSTSTRKKLTPLNVQCNDTDCPNGLHCYRRNKKLPAKDQYPDGVCWRCGADDIVDWDRVHRLDPDDLDYLIEMLRTELIRNVYWDEADIHSDQKAVNHARRKGRVGVREAIHHRFDKYLRTKGGFDGRQTGKTESVVNYAQHATATCCRKCMAYWYGIDVNEVLTDPQIDFFTELLMRYVDDKLPGLQEHGVYVPPIRGK